MKLLAKRENFGKTLAKISRFRALVGGTRKKSKVFGFSFPSDFCGGCVGKKVL